MTRTHGGPRGAAALEATRPGDAAVARREDERRTDGKFAGVLARKLAADHDDTSRGERDAGRSEPAVDALQVHAPPATTTFDATASRRAIASDDETSDDETSDGTTLDDKTLDDKTLDDETLDDKTLDDEASDVPVSDETVIDAATIPPIDTPDIDARDGATIIDGSTTDDATHTHSSVGVAVGTATVTGGRVGPSTSNAARADGAAAVDTARTLASGGTATNVPSLAAREAPQSAHAPSIGAVATATEDGQASANTTTAAPLASTTFGGSSPANESSASSTASASSGSIDLGDASVFQPVSPTPTSDAPVVDSTPAPLHGPTMDPASTRGAATVRDPTPLVLSRAEDLALAIEKLNPIPRGGASIEIEAPGVGAFRLHVAVHGDTLRVRIDADANALSWFAREHDGLTSAARQAVPEARNVELEMHCGTGSKRERSQTRDEHDRSDAPSAPTRAGARMAPVAQAGPRSLVDVIA